MYNIHITFRFGEMADYKNLISILPLAFYSVIVNQKKPLKKFFKRLFGHCASKKLHDSWFYGTTGCFTIKLFKRSPCAHHNSPHVNYAQWHFNGLFKVNEWDLLVKIFVCEQAYRQESPKSSASQCSSMESPGIFKKLLILPDIS